MKAKSSMMNVFRLAFIGLLFCPLIVSAESESHRKDIYPQVVQLPAPQMTSPNATESLMSSGSKYSQKIQEYSTNEQGQHSPAHAPGGPRKLPDHEEEWWITPLGDALWPLLLCAGAFLIIRLARRKRANE